MTAFMAKGIHARVDSEMASAPANPASAHKRNRARRPPVRSERLPMKYPATGAVMLVK
jgi:hypothetical protein